MLSLFLFPQISTLLREKTSMQNELLSTVKKHSEDMSEAEKRFRKEMVRINLSL